MDDGMVRMQHSLAVGFTSGTAMRSQADILQNRLVSFGVTVCAMARRFPRDVAGTHVASQVVRSATAPAAHYAEARDAESRHDFIHKLKLGIKELRETSAWLDTAHQLGTASPDLSEARRECNELTAILVSSVKTARNRRLTIDD